MNRHAAAYSCEPQKLFSKLRDVELSRSGRVVKSAVLWHGWSWIQALAQVQAQAPAPPMLVDTSDGYKYVGQKCLAVMQAVKRSAGVATEVNLRNSVQTRKCSSKKSILTLKPKADVTRSPK